MNPTAPTAAAPSVEEQIRAFVPDHAAILLRGPQGFGDSTWTWSTPKGLWMISLASRHPGNPDAGTVRLSGPGGSWTLNEDDTTESVRRLEGMLRALGAIPAASAAH